MRAVTLAAAGIASSLALLAMTEARFFHSEWRRLEPPSWALWGILQRHWRSATNLGLQPLAIEQYDPLTVHSYQTGVGESAQRAADHLPHRAQPGCDLCLGPRRCDFPCFGLLEEEPGKPAAHRTKGEILHQVRQVVKSIGEVPQESHRQLRVLPHQPEEVLPGHGVEGDPVDGLDCGVVDAIGLEEGYGIEALPWSEADQDLLSPLRRDPGRAGVALGDEVGSPRRCSFQDDDLVLFVGPPDRHAGEPSQRLPGEVGEERYAAQRVDFCIHCRSIVAESRQGVKRSGVAALRVSGFGFLLGRLWYNIRS